MKENDEHMSWKTPGNHFPFLTGLDLLYLSNQTTVRGNSSRTKNRAMFSHIARRSTVAVT